MLIILLLKKIQLNGHRQPLLVKNKKLTTNKLSEKNEKLINDRTPSNPNLTINYRSNQNLMDKPITIKNFIAIMKKSNKSKIQINATQTNNREVVEMDLRADNQTKKVVLIPNLSRIRARAPKNMIRTDLANSSLNSLTESQVKDSY